MALCIGDLFEHAVDAFPDRLAVACQDRQLTYAELEDRSNRLANFLAARGVGPGDHVAFYGINSIEAVVTLLAVYKLRAVVINLNYRYVADELRYVLVDADVTAVVHDRALGDRVAAVLPDLPAVHTVVAIDPAGPGGLPAQGGETPDAATNADARAYAFAAALAAGSPDRSFGPRSGDDRYIIYTGGTTGYPKGVIWRHEDVWRTLGGGIDFLTGIPLSDEWAQTELGRESGGRVRMCLAPLIHGNAQWAAYAAFFCGDTVVIAPRFDPHEIWRTVEHRRVNVLILIGDAMARPLIEALAEGGYDASSLMAVSTSAALFSPLVQAQYARLLPNVLVTDAIGSSETGFAGIGLAEGNSSNLDGPLVAPGPQTLVLDDDGRPVGPGEVGRLARGGHIPLGYYKDPAKTAALFAEHDGKRYVLSGDFARLEPDGMITLLGRGNTCINTGGEKVFPEEVERVLKTCPEVFDTLVIAVPDERLGQAVAALIQLRPGCTFEYTAIENRLRQHLAGYKLPRTIWVVDRIGRLPSGKADFRWARRYAEEHPTEALHKIARTEH